MGGLPAAPVGAAFIDTSRDVIWGREDKVSQGGGDRYSSRWMKMLAADVDRGRKYPAFEKHQPSGAGNPPPPHTHTGVPDPTPVTKGRRHM